MCFGAEVSHRGAHANDNRVHPGNRFTWDVGFAHWALDPCLDVQAPRFSPAQLFFEDARRTPADRVIGLMRQTVCELQSLVWLAPLFVTNLRDDVVDKVFCSDASPFAAGVCSAPIGREAAKELWRHSEQRGFYTKLEEPATATLRELGLPTVPTFGSEGACGFDSAVPVPPSLQQGFQWDSLALFCNDSSWQDCHSSGAERTPWILPGGS